MTMRLHMCGTAFCNLASWIVSFPAPIMHARKGSGDIGTNSWFCKLSNHVIIYTGLGWIM